VVCAAAVVALSACGREAEQRALAAEAKLAQMDTIAAAKDSLVKEMISTNAFIGELNQELGKIKSGGTKAVVYDERVMPMEEYRTNMKQRVNELVTRLQENEKRLRSSQERLRDLGTRNKDMTARIATYDSMVVEYTKVMETQRLQIADLSLQVDTLSAGNTQLRTEVGNLSTQLTAASTQLNTVYMIAGTKKDLMAKGIVTEVGGSRVLGVGWRTGETLVPARTLSTEDFTPLTKQETLEITLPDPNKKYRLISRQNVEHLEVKPDKDGKVHGTLRIVDPEEFWGASRFLILVEG
jgi:myosin heavy subunit